MDSEHMARLSPETRRRVERLFDGAEQCEEAARMLDEQCGNNLAFPTRLDAHALERYRFAALKLSGGDLEKLRQAVTLAKLDWRDLLMAADFGHDIHAHERWLP